MRNLAACFSGLLLQGIPSTYVGSSYHRRFQTQTLHGRHFGQVIVCVCMKRNRQSRQVCRGSDYLRASFRLCLWGIAEDEAISLYT